MSFDNLPGTLLIRLIADDIFNTEQQTVQKLEDGDEIRIVWTDGHWKYEKVKNGNL